MLFLPYLVGCTFLIGRYPWGTAALPYSIRGYSVSFFFFSMVYLVLAGFLKEFQISFRNRFKVFSAYVFVWAFPDYWLGLDSVFYHRRAKALYYAITDPLIPRVQLEFFPSGFRTLGTIPGEGLLFGLILLLGTASFIFYRRHQKQSFFFYGLFLLVVFQTWIHQSLRSPYTYMPHFEKTPDYWYHSVLFANGTGAVNGDYPWFRQGEELFIGSDGPLAPLWDRLFPAFITSAFSRYFPPYHVGVFLNVLAWTAAVLALYFLAKHLLNERAARFTSLLMASSQGMIIYAGQPITYVFAYATLPILLALYWKFFQLSKPTTSRALLLGLVSALAALSYDLQPWWGVFLAVPFVLKQEKKFHFYFVGTSMLVYFFFHNLWRIIPAVIYHSALVDPSLNPVLEVVKVVFQFDFREWIQLTWMTISGWTTFSLRAFMWWFLTVVFGFFLLKRERKPVAFFTLLLFPGVATFTLMQWSRTEYYLQFPRIVFSAFPVVYLLSGKCLEVLYNRGKWSRAVVLVLVGFHLILMNLDTFGFPYIHMHWFYRGTTLNQIFRHVAQ